MTDDFYFHRWVVFQHLCDFFYGSKRFRFYFIGVDIELYAVAHEFSFGNEFVAHVRQASRNAKIGNKQIDFIGGLKSENVIDISFN